MRCISCNSLPLEPIHQYSVFHRVTSDCRPFSSDGLLAICPNCGLIQKPPSHQYSAELEAIYCDYSPYSQSAGSEQKVTSACSSGLLESRSSPLLQWLRSQINLPKSSTIIDFGCGLGNFLVEFSTLFPNWHCIGIDSSTYRQAQARHPEFLFASSLDNVNLVECGFFSLIHCFEHLPNPLEFLSKVSSLLAQNTILYIQIPDVTTSPFDLLIADHVAHYSPCDIRNLVCRVPHLDLISIDTPVAKEMSILLRVNKTTAQPDGISSVVPSANSLLTSKELVSSRLSLFQHLKELGLSYAQSDLSRLYIFGSSIAASWLASEVGVKNICSFIDEDFDRQGSSHLDLPIIAPANVPEGSIILMPLPPSISELIAQRHSWVPVNSSYLYTNPLLD